MLSSVERPPEPDVLAYERVGRFFRPSGEASNREERVATLFTMLPHSSKPGTMVRMTTGFGLLITRDHVEIAGNIRVDGLPAVGFTIHPLERKSAWHMEIEAILSPPEPPFLLVLFGKKTAIAEGLRLTVSRDILEIGGAEPRTIRRRLVLDSLDGLVGADTETWRRMSFLNNERLRDPARSGAFDEEVAKLRSAKGAKADAYRRALDVALAGPAHGTAEHEAIKKVLAYRKQRATGPAVGKEP